MTIIVGHEKDVEGTTYVWADGHKDPSELNYSAGREPARHPVPAIIARCYIRPTHIALYRDLPNWNSLEGLLFHKGNERGWF